MATANYCHKIGGQVSPAVCDEFCPSGDCLYCCWDGQQITKENGALKNSGSSSRFAPPPDPPLEDFFGEHRLEKLRSLGITSLQELFDVGSEALASMLGSGPVKGIKRRLNDRGIILPD